MSILKNEKDILAKSEKRALDEVHELTTRVHRLQVFSSLHIFAVLQFLLLNRVTKKVVKPFFPYIYNLFLCISSL